MTFLSSLYFWSFIFPNCIFCNYWVLPNQLKQCGDVEVNPGLINTITKNVNVGQVNIWSLLAPIKMVEQTLKHNLTKVDLVKYHILQHDYDIISQTIHDDKNALLPDLSPYCNHLINQKFISATAYI